jgi:hypothetical protein
MKVIITESQYNLAISKNLVFEEVNLSGYDDEDFIEVFLTYFRPWIKSKHGDEIGGRPFSYLLNTYLKEFCQDMGIDTGFIRYSSKPSLMSRAGREIVLLGKHTLPTLRSQKKFSEQHKRGLDIALKMLDLPDYVNIRIEEDEPYEVDIFADVDFVKAAKDLSIDSPFTKIQQKMSYQLPRFIEETMGIKRGKPVLGELEFHGMTNVLNFDEWVKKEGRVFKRALADKFPNDYRQLRFNYGNNRPEIKIGFTRYAGWNKKSQISEYLREVLAEKGYNTSAFNIQY